MLDPARPPMLMFNLAIVTLTCPKLTNFGFVWSSDSVDPQKSGLSQTSSLLIFSSNGIIADSLCQASKDPI